MRTHVTFRHPADFVPVSDEDGILSVTGADWFVSLLRQVPELDLRDALCQEDWGIVAFAERAERKFWIGLSAEEAGAWVAHFHHGSWAWLQRFSPSGDRELRRLTQDFHQVLANEAAVSEITWYREDDMMRQRQSGSAAPDEA
jgi:hypothetical protein